jgi:hypothetical protein
LTPAVPSPGSPKNYISARRRTLLERNIVHWTYWLGIACLLIALLWRAFNALGFRLPMYIKEGETVYYMSFYKASWLFFIAAIASAHYAWFPSAKAPAALRSRTQKHLASGQIGGAR